MPHDDTVVNINKGYALRRIGVFGSELNKEVVHTFVSMNDVCISSPNSEVCTFATGSTENNILELATILTSISKLTTVSGFEKETLSKLTGDHLRQILMQHHPERYLNESQSIAHLIDNQLVSTMENDDSLTVPSSSNTVGLDKHAIPRFFPTSVGIILSQVKNQKLGLDFLTNYQLKAFLSIVFLTIDQSYAVSNIHESFTIFNELILSQSIFALRYCSLNKEESLSKRPCVVVSTVFIRPSSNSRSTYTIYRLIPLPTVVNNNKYVYSNMPKYIGTSKTQQTVITWNEKSEIDQCSFSVVVLCTKIPLTVPLINLPCLSELFSDDMNPINKCEVIRSVDAQSGVTELGSGLWLFYNVRSTQFCQIYSPMDKSVEIITIREEVVVQMPCGKTITCFGNHLPPVLCTQLRFVILPTINEGLQPQYKTFQISMKNATDRLVSGFQVQSVGFYQDMVTDFTNTQPFLKRVVHEIGYTILSILCSFLLLMSVYILKCSTKRLQTKLDTLNEIVHDVLRE